MLSVAPSKEREEEGGLFEEKDGDQEDEKNRRKPHNPKSITGDEDHLAADAAHFKMRMTKPMCNYFSFGHDARTALGVEKVRGSSKTMNMWNYTLGMRDALNKRFGKNWGRLVGKHSDVAGRVNMSV